MLDESNGIRPFLTEMYFRCRLESSGGLLAFGLRGPALVVEAAEFAALIPAPIPGEYPGLADCLAPGIPGVTPARCWLAAAFNCASSFILRESAGSPAGAAFMESTWWSSAAAESRVSAALALRNESLLPARVP